MKHKTFWAFAVLVLVLFAAVFSGGCGGSSKTVSSIGEDVGSDMLGYFLSPDYEQTVGGLLEELGDNNLKGELKSAIGQYSLPHPK